MTVAAVMVGLRQWIPAFAGMTRVRLMVGSLQVLLG
jgi:hypothetical protein